MGNARLLQVLVSVLGISIGQVLLKLGALSMGSPSPGQHPLRLLFCNGYLLAGIALLGCSTLLWTWILRSVPLSAAYPFMALAFVFVPTICYVFLGETITWRHAAGAVLIVAGVVVVSA